MATVIFEAMDNGPQKWKDIEVEILEFLLCWQHLLKCAPLGHDFCVINLSNNLKPWEIIERIRELLVICYGYL